MTEEEAKTKWCPFVRVAKLDGIVGYNRLVDRLGESISSNSRCIGSACMAWRWLNPGETFDEWRQKAYGYKVETKDAVAGYCGLAGKP